MPKNVGFECELPRLDLTSVPLRCRREEPGELPPGGERAGAGQRGAAGLRHVQLPAANGQVRPAAAAAAGDPSHQPAGRGVPVLQTPERRRALQQPAHRDAARQESLGGGVDRMGVGATNEKEKKTHKHSNKRKTVFFYSPKKAPHDALERTAPVLKRLRDVRGRRLFGFSKLTEKKVKNT